MHFGLQLVVTNPTQWEKALTVRLSCGRPNVLAKDLLSLLRVQKELVPLTEPLILSTLHVSGFELNASERVVIFTGYELIPRCGLAPRERRIVTRFAMTATEARMFRDVLGGALREGY
jgi:hypothetical protein